MTETGLKVVPKVIIDTDPGLDDAVAILFALQSGLFDIAGITTVAGNLGIGTTTRNAGRLLAFAGRSDVPVLQGANQPLVREAIQTADIHGADGMGWVDLPQPAVPPAPEDAVAWLAALLMAEPAHSVTILALGPLTNLALLNTRYPEAAQRIRLIVAMGGAVNEPGNVGARAEFNFAADPDAASVMFAAGLPLVVVPLDVTRKVRATRDFCARLAAGGATGAKAAEIIDAYFQSTQGRESRPLHDPCVMLYAAQPDLFGVETLRLAVDVQAGPDAGALLPGEGDAVKVAMRVDADAALELLAKGLAG
jgi:purine nucleosidase/pyrimidine-specific ribonucleoside hydrolase